MDLDYSKETPEDIRLLDFIKAVLALKEVRRQGWIDVGVPDSESVADHTFGTSMIAMIISDKAGCNTERVLKMALLHDIAEVIIGDITPDTMPPDEKRKLESKAMEKILDKLPDMMQDSYKAMWHEYVDCRTDEAILVHNADKLDMAIQVKKYESQMTSASLAAFLKSAKDGIVDDNPELLIREVRL